MRRHRRLHVRVKAGKFDYTHFTNSKKSHILTNLKTANELTISNSKTWNLLYTRTAAFPQILIVHSDLRELSRSYIWRVNLVD